MQRPGLNLVKSLAIFSIQVFIVGLLSLTSSELMVAIYLKVPEMVPVIEEFKIAIDLPLSTRFVLSTYQIWLSFPLVSWVLMILVVVRGANKSSFLWVSVAVCLFLITIGLFKFAQYALYLPVEILSNV